MNDHSGAIPEAHWDIVQPPSPEYRSGGQGGDQRSADSQLANNDGHDGLTQSIKPTTKTLKEGP